jgi:hypothetical protein
MKNALSSKICSKRRPLARPPSALPKLDPAIRLLIWSILLWSALRCILIELWRDESAYLISQFPIQLTFPAALISFSLLFIMPTHPMSIPVAMGGGISISLIISYVKPYRARYYRLPGGR